ncbi:hypothetical protein ACIGO9_14980 [Nocardia asteroides]|uniref:hypothetical protein n=1 Tax=Nocardia asteroides TaxID=1824 RepID=UPI0037C63662
MTCTAFEQDAPLPTGMAILGAILGWSSDDELTDSILAAAADLVEIYRSEEIVAEPLVAARVEQMRVIDTAVAEALPPPGGGAAPHTETVGMAVARMAAYGARLDRVHTPASLFAAWGPLFELARAVDELINDLVTGRRRTPLSIWWAGLGSSVSTPEQA